MHFKSPPARLGMGCRGRETLQNLCDQIPGDALLYSMFKVDAEPIKCPIRGKNIRYKTFFAEHAKILITIERHSIP